MTDAVTPLTAAERVRRDQQTGTIEVCQQCGGRSYISPEMGQAAAVAWLGGRGWRGACCAHCGATLELAPPVVVGHKRSGQRPSSGGEHG